MNGWHISSIIPKWSGSKPRLRTLRHPALVIQSISDEAARLYYRFYSATPVGDKFVCVVVKVKAGDALVLTAYLTDKPKKGTVLWSAST